jgi:tripartite-type tricarboxylate transporter receptor subunit TctC
MTQLARRTLLAAPLIATTRAAGATDWPTRTVRILCGFATSGAIDALQRRIAQRLTERLGQTFVIDTRAGAGGNIATDALAKSAPDGHTLLLGPVGPVVTNPILLGARMPYNALTDFAPVMRVSQSPFVLLAHRSVPLDPAELVAWLRQNPEEPYGSPGVGSTGHLLGAQFSRMLGLRLQHVAYRSFSPADLLEGRLRLYYGGSQTMVALADDGRARAVLVTSAERERILPNVPTFREAGFPEMTANSWWGLFGPRGLPAAIQDRLRSEILRYLAEPEMAAWMRSVGQAPVPEDLAPDVFARFVETERVRWGRVIRESGITLE